MTGARPLFHVKICGVTSADDAALAAAAGADAIGINFVSGSPRRVDVATARTIAGAARPGLLVVGVFAGTPAADVRGIAHEVGLEAVQLHGHLYGPAHPVDPPAMCAELGDVTVIRAVRLGADGLAEARRWLAAAAAVGTRPAMAIVDATVPRGVGAGALGGTGARVDWAALAAEPPLGLPWALAGGLEPGNVTEAIRLTGATAVDVASGVESAPGRKDAARVRMFVEAARSAWAHGPVRPPATG